MSDETPRVICWQITMDHLWSDTWQMFQAIWPGPVSFIVEAAIDPNRVDQCWKPNETNGFHIDYLPRMEWWKRGRSIIDSNLDAVHVFLSFWGSRRFFPLILYAARKGVKVAVINEAYSRSPTGYFRDEPVVISWMKVLIRPALYRAAAMVLGRLARPGRMCVLPLSLRARDQLLHAGFSAQMLFPYAYFVDRRLVPDRQIAPPASGLRLVFVGALIKRKGLDIAIEAVRRLNRGGIYLLLDVYGSGDFQVHADSIPWNVRYRGVLEHENVQATIARYDALILPSRHDGWGVVVNEALLQGVPAVVSDCVGAKCLIENSGAGATFVSEDPTDLEAALREISTRHEILVQMKTRAMHLGNQILPSAGAAYLKAVLDCYFEGQAERPWGIWCDQGEAT